MYNNANEGTYYNRTRDMKLFYRLWTPEHPKGLIVFVHGAGEHSGAYSHIAMDCLHRHIAFAAPDLRGFGKSEGKRGYIRQFKDYLDDLDELIVRLQIQYPGLPIFLFGNSLGGLIAIRYVQQFRDKVTGVILSSPALGIRLKLPYFLRKLIELVSLLAPAWPVEFVKWNETLRKLKWLQAHLPNWTSEMLEDNEGCRPRNVQNVYRKHHTLAGLRRNAFATRQATYIANDRPCHVGWTIPVRHVI